MLTREEIRENILKLVKNKAKREGVTKLTPAMIAKGVGVSADHIRKLLRGDRVGSPIVLGKLATYLGCTIDDIIMPKKKTKS